MRDRHMQMHNETEELTGEKNSRNSAMNLSSNKAASNNPDNFRSGRYQNNTESKKHMINRIEERDSD